MSSRTILIIYLLVVNLASLVFMAVDKIRAVEHRFRIPESVLLILAAIGGSLGGIAGMLLFHHKIRRIKFRFGLPAILLIQLAAYLFLVRTAAQIVFL